MPDSRVNSFRGRVSLRSSAGANGPPGETEIGRLNPQRTAALMQLTEWPALQPGTLNVECDERELDATLDQRQPDLFERPDSVTYPDRYRHIPVKRGGYRYFLAILRFRNESQPVVLRRAVNPIAGRVEVYAAVHIRDRFGLNANDEIELQLVDAGIRDTNHSNRRGGNEQ